MTKLIFWTLGSDVKKLIIFALLCQSLANFLE